MLGLHACGPPRLAVLGLCCRLAHRQPADEAPKGERRVGPPSRGCTPAGTLQGQAVLMAAL